MVRFGLVRFGAIFGWTPNLTISLVWGIFLNPEPDCWFRQPMISHKFHGWWESRHPVAPITHGPTDIGWLTRFFLGWWVGQPQDILQHQGVFTASGCAPNSGLPVYIEMHPDIEMYCNPHSTCTPEWYTNHVMSPVVLINMKLNLNSGDTSWCQDHMSGCIWCWDACWCWDTSGCWDASHQYAYACWYQDAFCADICGVTTWELRPFKLKLHQNALILYLTLHNIYLNKIVIWDQIKNVCMTIPMNLLHSELLKEP